MVIKIRILITGIVIILLIISLVQELKRGEFKKDKKEDKVGREEKTSNYKFYLNLEQRITTLFNDFETRIVDLLKESHRPNNQEGNKSEPLSFPSKEDVQISFKENDLNTCILLFNEAIENNEKQGEFHRKFRPIRADIKNFEERRSNPDLQPEFTTSDSGKYFVVEIQDGKHTRFAVFPIFELTISDKNYKSGAWGEVFKCLGYEKGNSFGIKQIRYPAFFSREHKDTWKSEASGELELVKK